MNYTGTALPATGAAALPFGMGHLWWAIAAMTLVFAGMALMRLSPRARR
jgi:hypothetical protein